MKKRFLLFADSFLGTAGTGFDGRTQDRLFGGAEVYLYDLAMTLRDAGCDVTVTQKGVESKRWEFEGITVESVVTPSWWKWLSPFGVVERFHLFGRLLKSFLAQGYDHIHIHYFYQAWPFGNESMTGTCHGIEWDCPKQSLLERWSHWMTKRVAARALKNIGRVAANDTFFYRYVQSEVADQRQKITVIPNYVRTDIFHPNVPPQKTLREKYPSDILLLMPKNPAFARGTHVAIEALSKLKSRNVRLCIAGNSNLTGTFQALAQKLGVSERVHFLGHLDHHRDMPGLYRAADIVLVPSMCREATALAALEGMACGRPTIVTNIGGLSDIMENDAVGRCIEPNAVALADSIQSLIDRPEEREQIGRAAATYAAEKFRYELWQQRYLEFFGLSRATNKSGV